MKHYVPTKLPEMMELKNKKVLVFGLGKFGGGVGAAKFFASKGADVSVTDLKTQEQLRDSYDKIKDLNIKFHFGSQETLNLMNYDLICVNPAVSPFLPKLAEARINGVLITSEMNLFFARCKAKIVGITGSNGKSTTASLTAHLLRGSKKKIWFGGNIGNSLLPDVDKITEDDIVVLELSSFQLEELHRLRMSPTVSILTNLSNNHLDRHLSFDAYLAAKMSAFCYQKPKNISIINYDDSRSRNVLQYVTGRTSLFSLIRKVSPGAFLENDNFCVDLGKGKVEVAPIKSLKLLGNFNRANALAAILAASVLKTPPDAIKSLLPEFKNLNHRLEFVRDAFDVQFYNDSISTAPESTEVGILAFTKPVWLIVGGSDKGLDYNQLARTILKSTVVGVLGIGLIGKEILEIIASWNNKKAKPKNLELVHTKTLENSFTYLANNVKQGEVVLLSPGTASYDQFTDFEHRGEVFKQLSASFTPAFKDKDTTIKTFTEQPEYSEQEIVTEYEDKLLVEKSTAKTHIFQPSDKFEADSEVKPYSTDTVSMQPADYSEFKSEIIDFDDTSSSEDFEKELKENIESTLNLLKIEPDDSEELVMSPNELEVEDFDSDFTHYSSDEMMTFEAEEVKPLFGDNQEIVQSLDTGIFEPLEIDDDEEHEIHNK